MQLRSHVAELTSYDGVPRSEIARRSGCSQVQVFETLPSTMDVAHELAADGCESGMLVVAESQSSGRGREGKRWQSGVGGVWFTYLSRNTDVEASHVLSVRAGLALRHALGTYADSRLLLKWPNDVFDEKGKIAGILVETRWRESLPEWTAVGIGINLALPDGSFTPEPSCLREGARRSEVLCSAASQIRGATQQTGALTRDEVQEYMKHDMLRGRRVSQPAKGTVVGISEDGELVISNDSGIATFRSGSVVMEVD